MSGRALTGGCLCGAVRFSISEPFLSSSYCHCTRCQRRTGTGASANARVAVSGFELLAGGEDALRCWRPPDGAPKWFCSRCGSAMFSGDPERDEFVSVRLGALDGDPGIRPQHRQYVNYAAAWEPIPGDGLPRYGESR